MKEFQSKFSNLAKEGFEDLLQECLTHWLFVKDKYGAYDEKNHKTLMKEVIRNKLRDIGAKKGAQKRRMLDQSISLDQLLESTDEEDFGKVFAAEDQNFKKIFAEELSLALDRISENLSLRQKKLCKALGEEGMNIYQASKQLQIPRTTIYEEIKRIKEIFSKEGLQDYLEP